MKKQKTKTRLSLKTIIIMMIIMFSATLSYAQWQIDEGFEGGIIPADWTIYDVNGDGDEWFALEYTSHAHTGDWMAAVECYSGNGHDWLITPQVTIQSGDAFIFYARAWISTEDMNVKLSTTGNAIGNFNVTLENITGLGDSYVEYSYDLSAYAGQSIYLAIEWIQDTYGMVVDDVKVGQALAGDAGMVSIEVPVNYHLVNSEIYPSGTIQNYGSSDITANFDVVCQIFDETEIQVYSATTTHSGTLTPGETDAVTFATVWTPADTGFYDIVMYTDLTGDPYNSNDTLTSETEIVEHFGTGGPDEFGYRWIDSHEAGGPVYNWIEISGTGESAISYGFSYPYFAGDDNFSAPIPFGFSFPYYGIDRDSFHVDINGEFLLTQDNYWYEEYPGSDWDTDGFFFNYSFPVPGFTQVPALVAVLWDNLYADDGIGDVYFQTFGTEPNR
ncbi:MAG: choice-of-anchor J domain-containing protein, partial [Bacteroidales bacterium]|nr:choice-of-anchor J domain-containing protein [Bacteroidales bacterium]